MYLIITQNKRGIIGNIYKEKLQDYIEMDDDEIEAELEENCYLHGEDESFYILEPKELADDPRYR